MVYVILKVTFFIDLRVTWWGMNHRSPLIWILISTVERGFSLFRWLTEGERGVNSKYRGHG